MRKNVYLRNKLCCWCWSNSSCRNGYEKLERIVQISIARDGTNVFINYFSSRSLCLLFYCRTTTRWPGTASINKSDRAGDDATNSRRYRLSINGRKRAKKSEKLLGKLLKTWKWKYKRNSILKQINSEEIIFSREQICASLNIPQLCFVSGFFSRARFCV